MPVEKFFQRLRSGESPHGNRSRHMGPDRERPEFELAAEIPTGLEHRRISLPVTPKRAKVLPLYGATPLTRSYRIWHGKRSGSKAAHHPMRGFRSAKAAHRNAA